MTRRTLVSGLGIAALQLSNSPVASADETRVPLWKPKLGVLGQYTAANVEFARSQGYNNMILSTTPSSTLDAETATDSQIESARTALKAAKMNVSALQVTLNHIDPDPADASKQQHYFLKSIEMAGKLGVPYIGTASGKNEALSFPKQIDTIVRVYQEKYFKACEQNKVRILWEPWPEGPNLATSPVGFEALLKGFGRSPYVGLQYDPSHLVRQFMDPIQTARDFAHDIYDVHLKDTEIIWPVLRAGGINPVNKAQWWRYRIPGMGSIPWSEFFSVLQSVGYAGAMSVEHEDDLYGASTNTGPDFSPDYKVGFVMARRYLSEYVP